MFCKVQSGNINNGDKFQNDSPKSTFTYFLKIFFPMFCFNSTVQVSESNSRIKFACRTGFIGAILRKMSQCLCYCV